jgi:Ca2+-binding RTX toxin-like protein
LPDNVENLTLTGTTAINGIGNAGNNVITGNTGNNSLNGGAGEDSLWGDKGNDTLYGEEGDDTLNAVEDIYTLIGGLGNTLIGGLGNDIYIVDSTTDVIRLVGI